jgi:hypothetical protein
MMLPMMMLMVMMLKAGLVIISVIWTGTPLFGR